MRPFQQGKGDAHGGNQVEAIAQQLQVALGTLGHAQARQAQQSPQLRHPVLGGAEGADPSAEEYTRQNDGG